MRFVLARVTSRAPSIAAAVAGAFGLGVMAMSVPHAYRNLIESREVMGTHGLPGYDAQYTKTLFAMEVAKRTTTDAPNILYPL